MSLKAKIFSVLGILLMVVLLTNCKLIGYGITQGLGQLRMVRNAVPIDTLLNDPSYPDSLKQKLLYIKESPTFISSISILSHRTNLNSAKRQYLSQQIIIVVPCKSLSFLRYLFLFHT